MRRLRSTFFVEFRRSLRRVSGTLGARCRAQVGALRVSMVPILVMVVAGAGLMVSVRLAGAASVVTTVAADGSSRSLVLEPGSSATFSVAAPVGSRLVVGLTASSFGAGGRLLVTDQSGAEVAGSDLVGSSVWLGPLTVPSGGLVSVTVDGGVDGGGARLGVWTVPADASAVVGAPTTAGVSAGSLTLGVPGQQGVVVFAGHAGERVSVRIDGSSIGYGSAAVTDATGTLAGSGWFSYGRSLVGPFVVGMDGAVSVRVVPQLGLTGSLRMSVFAVPADAETSLVAVSDGASASLAVPVPGERSSALFAAPTGRVGVVVDGAGSLAAGSVTLVDGAGVVRGRVALPGGGYLGPVVVASGEAGGVWRVVADGAGTTGQVAVRVYAVPEDPALAGSLGGAGVAVALPAPGMRGSVTFPLEMGEKVAVDASASSLVAMLVRVVDPAGVEVARAVCGVGACPLPIVAAQSTGAYQVLVDPNGAATGSVTVSAASVVDVSAAVIAAGASTTLTFATRGQSALVGVSAAAGSRLSVRVDAAGVRGAAGLVGVGGGIVGSAPLAGGLLLGPVVVGASGSVSVRVDAQSAGTVTLHADTVIDASTTTSVGAAAVALTVSGAGAVGSVDVALRRLEAIRVDLSASTFADGTISVEDDAGTVLATAPLPGSADGSVLDGFLAPTSGVYHLRLRPAGSVTSGSLLIGMVDVARPPIDATPGSPVLLETTGDGAGAQATLPIGTARLGVVVSSASTPGVVALLDGSSVLAQATITSGAGSVLVGPVRSVSGSLRVVWTPTDGAVAGSLLVDPEVVPDDADVVVGATGSAVSVSTVAAGQGAVVRVHADTGEQIRLDAASDGVFAASVSVIGADGTILSPSTTMAAGGRWQSSVVAASSGWLRVVFAATGAAFGSVSVTATSLGGQATRSLGLDDPFVAIPLDNTASATGVVAVPAGARVTLLAAPTTITGHLELATSDGTTIASTPLRADGDAASTPQAISASGSYLVRIVADAGQTGAVRVRVASAGADLALAAATGQGAVTATTTRPGERVVATITSTATSPVAIAVHAPGLTGATLTVTTATGTVSTRLVSDDQTVVVPSTPAGAQIGLVIDPDGAATGSVTMTASTTSAAPVSNDGVPTSILEIAGVPAPADLTLDAGAGVGFETVDVSPGAALAVSDSTGVPVVSATSAGWLGVQPLAKGSYPIRLSTSDPSGAAVVTVRAWAEQDAAAVALHAGVAAAAVLPIPGARARFMIHAQPGDRLAAGIAGSSLGETDVTIHAPDESVAARGATSADTGVVASLAVVTGGVYTVEVAAGDGSTGAASLTVDRAAKSAPRRVVVNGAAVAETITGAGQGTWLVNAQQGWTLTINESGTLAGGQFSIWAPDGALVAASALSGSATSLATVPLPATGAYRVVVDPSDGSHGSVVIGVSSADAPASSGSALVIGAAPISVTVPAGETRTLALPTSSTAIVVHASSSTSGGAIRELNAGAAADGAMLGTDTFLPAVTPGVDGVLVVSAPTTSAFTAQVSVLDATARQDTISLGDDPRGEILDTPGASIELTTTAATTDRERFAIAGSTIEPAAITITSANVVLARATITADAGYVDFTAPSAGATITIKVTAAAGAAGGFDAVLADPAAYPTIIATPPAAALGALADNALAAAANTALSIAGNDATPHVTGDAAHGFSFSSVAGPTRLGADQRDGTATTTAAGLVTLHPLDQQPANPQVIGGSAVVYQDTASATDMIYRASAAGYESFLQLRDGSAPTVFRWQAQLPPGASLEQVSATRVAVVVPTTADDLAAAVSPRPGSTAVPTTLTSHVTESAAQLADANKELAAATNATLIQHPPVDTLDSGAPAPWSRPYKVLAVFDAAWARDHNNTLVPTRLSVSGTTITLTVDHTTLSGVTYPVLVDPAFVADFENERMRDYQRLFADEDPVITQDTPAVAQCTAANATTTLVNQCVTAFSEAASMIDAVQAFLSAQPYSVALNQTRATAYRHALYQAWLAIDLAQFGQSDATAIGLAQLFEPTPVTDPSSTTRLGYDQCGQSIASGVACSTVPAVGDLIQSHLNTRTGTTDAAVPPLTTWASTINQDAVAPVLNVSTGVERRYAYTSGTLGWGASWLVNDAANQDTTPTSTTTHVAADGTPAYPNVLVHWSPLSSAGKGLATVVSVTYNSNEKPSAVWDGAAPLATGTTPGVNPSALGEGWTLGISGLTPLNEGLVLSDASATATTSTPPDRFAFRDIDGTVHRFLKDTSSTPTGWTAYWPQNGEQLYAARITDTTINAGDSVAPANPDGSIGAAAALPVPRWEVSTRDGVTYVFDAAGKPMYVRDRDYNRIAYQYESTSEGGRIIGVVDQRGRRFTIGYVGGSGRVATITGHPTVPNTSGFVGTITNTPQAYLPTPGVAFLYTAGNHLGAMLRCGTRTNGVASGACTTGSATLSDHVLAIGYAADTSGQVPLLTSVTRATACAACATTPLAYTGDTTTVGYTSSMPDGVHVRDAVTVTPPQGTSRYKYSDLSTTNPDAISVGVEADTRQTIISDHPAGSTTPDRVRYVDLDGAGRPVRVSDLATPTNRAAGTANDLVTRLRWQAASPAPGSRTTGFVADDLVATSVEPAGAVTRTTYTTPLGSIASVTDDNKHTTRLGYTTFPLYTCPQAVSCPGGVAELETSTTKPNQGRIWTVRQGSGAPSCAAAPNATTASVIRAATTIGLAAPVGEPILVCSENDMNSFGSVSYAYYSNAAAGALLDNEWQLQTVANDPLSARDAYRVERYDQNGLPDRVSHGTIDATSGAYVANDYTTSLHDNQGQTIYAQQANNESTTRFGNVRALTNETSVDQLIDDPDLLDGTWTQYDPYGRDMSVTTPQWAADVSQRGKLYVAISSYIDNAASTPTAGVTQREAITSDASFTTITGAGPLPMRDAFAASAASALPVAAAPPQPAGVRGSATFIDALDRAGLTARLANAATGTIATKTWTTDTAGTPSVPVALQSETGYAATGEAAFTLDASQYANWLLQKASVTPNLSESFFGAATTYDALGRVVSKTAGDVTPATSPPSAVTRRSYYCWDNAGRLILQTRPRDDTGTTPPCSWNDYGFAASYIDLNSYDGVGNLVASTHSATGGTDTYTYDADNNPITHTDPLGHTTTTVYTVGDQPYAVIQPTDATHNAMSLASYTSDGHLAATMTPSEVVLDGIATSTTPTAPTYTAFRSSLASGSKLDATFYYYRCGRLTSTLHSSGQDLSTQQSLLYDHSGNIVRSGGWNALTPDGVDPVNGDYAYATNSCAEVHATGAYNTGWTSGKSLSYTTYMDTGAIASDHTAGRSSLAYGYTDPTQPTTKTSRQVCGWTGTVVSNACSGGTDAGGTEGWTYDLSGWSRPVATHTWTNAGGTSPAVTDTFTTDPVGRVTKAVGGGGVAVSMTHTTSATGATTMYITYNDFGQDTHDVEQKPGAPTTNSAVVTNEYDADGMLWRRVTSTGNHVATGAITSTALDFRYSDDLLIGVYSGTSSLWSNNGSVAYSYDVAGRLIDAQRSNSATGAQLEDTTTSYSYTGQPTDQAVFNAAGTKIADHTYTYLDSSGGYQDGRLVSERYWTSPSQASSWHTATTVALACTTSATACTNSYSYTTQGQLQGAAIQKGWDAVPGVHTNADETDCYWNQTNAGNVDVDAQTTQTGTIWRYKTLNLSLCQYVNGPFRGGTGGTMQGSITSTLGAGSQITSQRVITPRDANEQGATLQNWTRYYTYNASGDVCSTRRRADGVTPTSVATPSIHAACPAESTVFGNDQKAGAGANGNATYEWWFETDNTYGPFDRIQTTFHYDGQSTASIGGAQNSDSNTYDPLGRVVQQAAAYHQQGYGATTTTSYIDLAQGVLQSHTTFNDYASGVDRTYADSPDGTPLALQTVPDIRTSTGPYYPVPGPHGTNSLILTAAGTILSTYATQPNGTQIEAASDGPAATSGWNAAIGSTQNGQAERQLVSDLSAFAGAANTIHNTPFDGVTNFGGPSAVNLGARQYNTTLGGFQQFDTYHDPNADLNLTLNPLTNNRTAYGSGNAATYTDYDGHCGSPSQPCPERPTPADTGHGRSSVYPSPEQLKVAPPHADHYKDTWAWREGPASCPYFYRPLGCSGDLPTMDGVPIRDEHPEIALNMVLFLVPVGEEVQAGRAVGALVRSERVLNWVRRFGFGGNAAEDAGGSLLSDAARACDANSFTATTLVSMADGSKRPIRRVGIGDLVLATDPQSGETAARPVTGLIVHSGQHVMVDVTLADGSTITATDHHPFWDATTDSFTYADHLHLGDELVEAGGARIRVAGLRVYREDVTAYNLTVDGIHTYYAGPTPVLVHNSCGDLLSRPSQIADRLGVSTRDVRTAIHAVKRGLPRGGEIRNPDVFVDPLTGEVYPEVPGGVGDSIGNLFDHLPRGD